MKQRATCARCGRKRYTDRMRSVPGRVVGEADLWVCVARSSCKTARKARRHLPALDPLEPATPAAAHDEDLDWCPVHPDLSCRPPLAPSSEAQAAAAAGLPVVRHVIEPTEHDGTHLGTLAQIESLLYRARRLADRDDVDPAAVQVRVQADAAGRLLRIDVIW